MKKNVKYFILFLVLFLMFFPVKSFTDWDPQKTVAIYFYNEYGQFMSKDIDAFGVEIITFLNQNGMFVWFLGISQKYIVIERIKKMAKVYVVLEYRGNIETVSGNKGAYSLTLTMKLKGFNLNNDNKKFEGSFTGVGSKMPDLSNARSLALQQIGVKLTEKYLKDIKSLFDKE